MAWNDNKFASTSAWTKGDFTVDGEVDGADFVTWNANKFQTADNGLANRGLVRDFWFALLDEEDDVPDRTGGEQFLPDALFAKYI